MVNAYILTDSLTISPQLTVIDTSSDTVSATVPLPVAGEGIAFTPDGVWAYITDFLRALVLFMRQLTRLLIGLL